MLDKNLLDILVCPICKSKLIYIKKNDGLLCKADKLLYSIHDGIPVMIAEKARQLNSDSIEELLKKQADII